MLLEGSIVLLFLVSVEIFYDRWSGDYIGGLVNHICQKPGCGSAFVLCKSGTVPIQAVLKNLVIIIKFLLSLNAGFYTEHVHGINTYDKRTNLLQNYFVSIRCKFRCSVLVFFIT
jgi:hypothetical protein